MHIRDLQPCLGRSLGASSAVRRQPVPNFLCSQDIRGSKEPKQKSLPGGSPRTFNARVLAHAIPPQPAFSRSFCSRLRQNSPPSLPTPFHCFFGGLFLPVTRSISFSFLLFTQTTTCLTRVTVPDNLRKPAFRGLADVGAVLAHEEHLVQVCRCLRLLDNGPFLRNRHHHSTAEHIQWCREFRQSIPKPHIGPL